jgi:hypothetical protein
MESFEAFQVSSSLLRVLAIGSAVPFLVIGAPVRADQGAIPVLRMMTNITELEVVNAQKLWCGSLLNRRIESLTHPKRGTGLVTLLALLD